MKVMCFQKINFTQYVAYHNLRSKEIKSLDYKSLRSDMSEVCWCADAGISGIKA